MTRKIGKRNREIAKENHENIVGRLPREST